MNALLLTLALSAGADPQPWDKDEAAHLKNIKQVTFDYVRAGEGYFSPDGTKIIFQAEEKNTGNPFYQIFVMDLKTGKAVRVSPGNGRTTCGYFRPDGKKVIWASSHGDPDAKKHQEAEYKQREEDRKKGIHRRYTWDFDPHMKIYESNLDGTEVKCLTPNAKVYTAEGSYSADGKKIVFSSGNEGNVQLFTMNADGSNVKRLTDAPNCYNGGPFFSPDGTRVVFRADRKEKHRLQLYVINADGTGEKALTNEDKWVFWAPFWYKDGKHIIFTGADHSNELVRPNYDLWWMRIEDDEKGPKPSPTSVFEGETFSTACRFSPFSTLGSVIPSQFCTASAQPKKHKMIRITYAPGADVLPVFSPDYKKIMWTRSPDGRSPSQLYIADFTPPKDE